jgi:hypothetical protein
MAGAAHAGKLKAGFFFGKTHHHERAKNVFRRPARFTEDARAPGPLIRNFDIKQMPSHQPTNVPHLNSRAVWRALIWSGASLKTEFRAIATHHGSPL